MKKQCRTRNLTALLLTFLLLCQSLFLPTFAADSDGLTAVGATAAVPFDLTCKAAVLMEASTGTVLYAKNPDEALPPASVTKVMTVLLVMEAIDAGKLALDTKITVSAYAASMGGSQVYLKEGETMRLEDLLKSVVIASANDAAVALAEAVAGSVDVFVARMNERARELGMEHTCFENVTGLDDTATKHLISAKDIAIMSRELLRHEKILEYTSIWMDTIRDGVFGLTNTNRLIRFYRGATGLKTGSTAKAGFCISATAKREDMHLICVIMGAESRDIRNAEAQKLLDWGFANYGLYRAAGAEAEPLRVVGGTRNTCRVAYPEFVSLLEKGKMSNVSCRVETAEQLTAPVREGDAVGRVVYSIGDEEIGEVVVRACETVPKIGFGEVLRRVFLRFLFL